MLHRTPHPDWLLETVKAYFPPFRERTPRTAPFHIHGYSTGGRPRTWTGRPYPGWDTLTAPERLLFCDPAMMGERRLSPVWNPVWRLWERPLEDGWTRRLEFLCETLWVDTGREVTPGEMGVPDELHDLCDLEAAEAAEAMALAETSGAPLIKPERLGSRTQAPAVRRGDHDGRQETDRTLMTDALRDATDFDIRRSVPRLIEHIELKPDLHRGFKALKEGRPSSDLLDGADSVLCLCRAFSAITGGVEPSETLWEAQRLIRGFTRRYILKPHEFQESNMRDSDVQAIRTVYSVSSDFMSAAYQMRKEVSERFERSFETTNFAPDHEALRRFRKWSGLQS